MADDSDIEWLTYRAAIDRAHQFAGDRHMGTGLLLEHMFAGRIKAISKLTVVENPRRGSAPDRVEARDWCLLSSFWEPWNGQLGPEDVPELGRFVKTKYVFRSVSRYDPFQTEAHGVKLRAADVDEWFPGEAVDDEPAVTEPSKQKNPGGKQAGKQGDAHAAFSLKLNAMDLADLKTWPKDYFGTLLADEYETKGHKRPHDQNAANWAWAMRNEVIQQRGG